MPYPHSAMRTSSSRRSNLDYNETPTKGTVMNPNLLIAVRGVTLGIILALAYGDVPKK